MLGTYIENKTVKKNKIKILYLKFWEKNKLDNLTGVKQILEANKWTIEIIFLKNINKYLSISMLEIRMK